MSRVKDEKGKKVGSYMWLLVYKEVEQEYKIEKNEKGRDSPVNKDDRRMDDSGCGLKEGREDLGGVEVGNM